MSQDQVIGPTQFWKTSLGQRLMTAIVLVPLVLYGIFYLSNTTFSCIIALIMLVGAWEWANFFGWSSQIKRCSFVAIVGLTLLVVAQLSAYVVYVFGVLWWLVAFLAIVGYPGNRRQWNYQLSVAIMGVITLSVAWFAMTDLQSTEHGSRLVFFVMCVIWGADTGAYFAGRRWGRRKLAPAVSPGKSIAGLVGGIVVTLLFSMMVLTALDLAAVDKSYYLLLILVTVLFSVVGDLFESMLKRNVGIKDSSQLLPGHGGVLDRIDSLTAAVPIFSAGLYFNGAFIAI